MNISEYAAAVQHTDNLIIAGVGALIAYKKRKKILTHAADELQMRPSTLRRVLTEPPGDVAHIRSGLMRVKCYRAVPVLLSAEVWTSWAVTTWTGGAPDTWATDWYALYDEAVQRRVLTDARKWYATLSDDVYTVPLLAVEILARLVGYPCAFRVSPGGDGARPGAFWRERYGRYSPDRRGSPDWQSELLEHSSLRRDLKAGTWRS